MEKTFSPQLNPSDTDSYKLYLYIEQIRQETEGRLKHIENQLEIIKGLIKGGE